jgi:hypothetical protein
MGITHGDCSCMASPAKRLFKHALTSASRLFGFGPRTAHPSGVCLVLSGAWHHARLGPEAPGVLRTVTDRCHSKRGLACRAALPTRRLVAATSSLRSMLHGPFLPAGGPASCSCQAAWLAAWLRCMASLPHELCHGFAAPEHAAPGDILEQVSLLPGLCSQLGYYWSCRGPWPV